MNGEQIIEIFRTIVDDALDPTYELFLLNTAKDLVEGGYDWNFNRGLDQSKSTAPGDTYLSMKNLPSDMLTPRKLYIAGDINPYNLISYEDRERYKDIYKRWYVDWVNRQFALCGGISEAKVISLFYARSSPAITLATTPVWPSTFHSYLAYKMADIHESTADADDINFRMSKESRQLAADILRGMRLWDASIKVAQYNAKNELRADLSTYPNVVGENFLPS